MSRFVLLVTSLVAAGVPSACRSQSPSPETPGATTPRRSEPGLLGEPRTAQSTRDVDGTVTETHHRPDGSVALRATYAGDQPLAIAALSATGATAWRCDLSKEGPPQCLVNDDAGQPLAAPERDELTLLAMQRYQRARRTLSGETSVEQGDGDGHGHEDKPQPSPQAAGAWEEKRQRTWKTAEPYFQRVDELLTLGFPILVAPTLAREELATGTGLVPRRRPLAPARAAGPQPP